MISYPLQVGTTVTRVIESGSGSTPVIFVHGVSAYAHRWLRNLDELAGKTCRSYAFDLPGHGFASKDGTFDHSVPGYADFLDAFMDALETGPAILVGTSLGGHIAATLACRRPERVRALVLVGSLGITPAGTEVCRMIAGAILETGRDGIREKLVRAHANPALVTDEWIEEEFRINNSGGAREIFERLSRYIGAHLDEDCVGEALASLSRRFPILLAWGEHDRSVGMNIATAAHQLLAGSRLAVIRGAGHAPYFECPEKFNRVVGDFLSGALDESAPDGVIYV